MHSARNFAAQEGLIENSENNLKKLQLLCAHLNVQQDVLHRRAAQLEEVKEQVQAMQRWFKYKHKRLDWEIMKQVYTDFFY